MSTMKKGFLVIPILALGLFCLELGAQTGGVDPNFIRVEPVDVTIQAGGRAFIMWEGGSGAELRVFWGECCDVAMPIEGPPPISGSNIQFYTVPPLFETTQMFVRVCSDFACDYSRTVTITVEGADEPGPFDNAVELGDGWVSDWMGTFNTNLLPWIFHGEHGWMFIWEDSTADNLFAFDLTSNQWFFTADASYPNLYSFLRNSWVFYFAGTSGPRQFVDLVSSEFFNLD